MPETVLAEVLRDGKVVAKGDERGGDGVFGKEDGGEVGVADACPVKGAVEGGAAGDLLRGFVRFPAAAEGIELRAGVGLRIFLVAEAAGPTEQRADRRTVAGDLDVSMEDVGLVEGERFSDVDGAVRELEGEIVRGAEIAGCRRDVHGALQAGG